MTPSRRRIWPVLDQLANLRVNFGPIRAPIITLERLFKHLNILVLSGLVLSDSVERVTVTMELYATWVIWITHGRWTLQQALLPTALNNPPTSPRGLENNNALGSSIAQPQQLPPNAPASTDITLKIPDRPLPKGSILFT